MPWSAHWLAARFRIANFKLAIWPLTTDGGEDKLASCKARKPPGLMRETKELESQETLRSDRQQILKQARANMST